MKQLEVNNPLDTNTELLNYMHLGDFYTNTTDPPDKNT